MFGRDVCEPGMLGVDRAGGVGDYGAGVLFVVSGCPSRALGGSPGVCRFLTMYQFTGWMVVLVRNSISRGPDFLGGFEMLYYFLLYLLFLAVLYIDWRLHLRGINKDE